ncbi:SBBP repeat-containing protein [Corallococcus sp. M34]|uniref:SBBP repeat-containing protein n=1 Tax=Citreicoccus inhibens TaxID=2849499 RepID=UPI0013155BD0|nr:SBBP repeat-containing protein [Citreicoccus inhibens]MBU8899765.1 SBBP repeat-containing protein [Citreicoccus inhibens]
MKSFKNLFLAGAMGVLALPGCQGADSPVEGATDETGSSAQSLCGVTMVPAMTSATSPSGIVTASGDFSTGYPAWQAFDSSIPSMWISQENQTPAWLAYEWVDGPRTVQSYAIQYSNGSITTRAPKNWTFEGWNGSAWVVLDTRTNQVSWGGGERRVFTLSTPATYRKFRINISDDNDTRAGIVVISMGTLELIGCAPTTVNALWVKTQGAPDGFTRQHDLVGDLAGRTYVTGMTNVGLEGNPAVSAMDGFLNAYNSSGAKIFAAQFGVTNGATVGYGIARNSTYEQIYVAGLTDGSLDGTASSGGRDFFLTKYRYTGVRQWTRQLGVSGYSTEGYGVAVDGSDNAFVVGSTDAGLDGNVRTGRYDAFVTKYDASGNKQWTRQVGATSQDTIGRRASADAAGNVFVSGWTTGGLDGNTRVGGQDFFVVKYNAAGVKQWTRQNSAPGGAVASIYGSALDAAGNIYLVGYVNGPIDGNPTGYRQTTFLAKYDTAGVKQWTRQFGSASGTFGNALFIDASGVYVSGSGVGDVSNSASTGTEQHPFIAKFDTAGNIQWFSQQPPATKGGVDQRVFNMGMSIDEAGNFYMAGYLYGDYGGNTIKGNPDGYVMKLPPH